MERKPVFRPMLLAVQEHVGDCEACSEQLRIAERAVTLASGDTCEATATLDQATRSMRTVSTAVKLELGDAIALSIPAQIADNAPSAWEDWLILRVREPRTK